VKSFEDLDTLVGAVPFAVVNDLRTIDTGRGSEALYQDKLPALLTSLADRARVASIEASSAIEGVVVENRARAAEIVAGRADQLRDRSEQELAGYRSALDYLYQERWRPLNVGLVLHLHRLLFQYTPTPGGQLKQVENVVVDRLPDGTRVKRFTPVPATATPAYLDELVARYLGAQDAGRHHPVVVTGLFVLDLLTIHPFVDGNGRIARALTNALLQDSGYDVTPVRLAGDGDREVRRRLLRGAALLDPRLARRPARPVAVAAVLRERPRRLLRAVRDVHVGRTQRREQAGPRPRLRPAPRPRHVPDRGRPHGAARGLRPDDPPRPRASQGRRPGRGRRGRPRRHLEQAARRPRVNRRPHVRTASPVRSSR